MTDCIIIGYGGHSYVVIDTLIELGFSVSKYVDEVEKESNPFNLSYLGKESSDESLQQLEGGRYFVSIGNNAARSKVTQSIISTLSNSPMTLIHPKSTVSNFAKLGSGVLVAPNASINAQATIADGVICNTASVIEHECQIGAFAHIAPGAVLAGNVTVGNASFIGANAVVKEGVNIGKNVIVGAGSVIINDVPDNSKVVGNPGRIISTE